MRKRVIVTVVVLMVAGALGVAYGHEASKHLPPGPIHDRHELMEGIGKNAKVIGDAVKSGKFKPAAGAAAKIQTSATKIVALFPQGSTHPHSRAKPEIWTNWAKFENTAKQLEATAGEVVSAARNGGDVKGAANKMFGACKTCHDDFRVPEKDEK